MKKIIYTIIALASLGCMQGCSDFLGNKPKGYTIPEKLEDYQKLINSQSLTRAYDDDKPAYFTDDVKLLDKNASATDRNYISKADHFKNVFSFQPGQVMVPGSKDGLWNSVYSRVFTYNIVINDVMKSKDGTDAEKNAIRAEALFGRAFEYLYLVNYYGRHYDAATAATDYGIPYLMEGDINLKYTRNTVKEVYDFILADLDAAKPFIKKKTASNNHPNEAALNSLYARMYFYIGDHVKALEFANKAFAANEILLDYNKYEKRDSVTFGRVHLKGDRSAFMPDIYHPEANYLKLGNGNPQSSLMLSDELRDLFKKDLTVGAIDLRKEFFTADDSVNMGRTDYFPGECAYVYYAGVNVGLTSVENLLIVAECEARIGSKDRAIGLVNKLRDNRIKGNVHLNVATNDEALVKVLEERRRELMMIGPHRYIDLKRLNKETRFAKSVVHSADGETWTLPANSPLYVFPINQEILDFNPGFPQYDRK